MSKNRNSHKNRNNTKDKNARKREAVLGTKKDKGLPKAPIVIGILLLVVAAAYFVVGNKDTTSFVATSAPVERSATAITYPVNLFDDGNARHFQYKADEGMSIKYFVLKSSDGVIRSAFDACDVCWPAGKGYYQEGDVMVCRNCGRKFATVLVNEVKGGCNPAPLTRTVGNSEVVIQVEDILAGKQYFDFSKRS